MPRCSSLTVKSPGFKPRERTFRFGSLWDVSCCRKKSCKARMPLVWNAGDNNSQSSWSVFVCKIWLFEKCHIGRCVFWKEGKKKELLRCQSIRDMKIEKKGKEREIDTQMSRIAYLMQCLGIPVILSTFACRIFDISTRLGVEISLVYFPLIWLYSPHCTVKGHHFVMQVIQLT